MLVLTVLFVYNLQEVECGQFLKRLPFRLIGVKQEVYVSVDVEASGPIPGEYSMLSLGACVVGNVSKTFYVELKPISEKYTDKALSVCKLSMQTLKDNGVEPAEAMRRFNDWLQEAAGEAKPVFVAFNATFDWSFVNYYFHRFFGRNSFGVSGLDIKAYYMGMKKCSWNETAKKRIDAKFMGQRKHTHNALDDAIEQAEIFEKMLTYKA